VLRCIAGTHREASLACAVTSLACSTSSSLLHLGRTCAASSMGYARRVALRPSMISTSFNTAYTLTWTRKASLQEGINQVFDQITVDPRLETFEQREREKRLADPGFTGEFIETRLYQKIFCAKEARNA
jgi:hypothetical protein